MQIDPVDSNEVNGSTGRPSPSRQDSSADDGRGGDAMDVDGVNGEAPATPSPEPPPPTLTNGQSIGIQSEKSTDVSDQTSILNLSSPSQTLMHITFNPQDPSIFATAGEALCRIWDLSKPGSASGQPSIGYDDIAPSSEEDSLASTVAWNPNGDILAVASRSLQSSVWVGSVALWSKHGRVLEDLSGTQDMVILLRWNAQGTRLLGITSSGERSSAVVVWDTTSSQVSSPCQIDGELRDAAWIDETRFVVCGRGIIAMSYWPSPATVALELYQEKAISSRTWVHVKHDVFTSCTVCAAEEDCLLAVSGSPQALTDVKVRQDAHSDQISALELSAPSNEYPRRIVASASLDLNVKIWSTPDLNLINILSIGASYPITALSFTTNGHLLAAASQNRISIWNPREQGPPKIIWRGELNRTDTNDTNHRRSTNGLMNGGQLAGFNENPAPDQDSAVGDLADEDGGLSYGLSWNTDGRKLVLGIHNKVSSPRDVADLLTDGDRLLSLTSPYPEARI